MKSLLIYTLSAVVVAATVVFNAGLAKAQAPSMPASPLAGGMAAASGDVIDVHGNSVVMPASYGQPCPPYGGPCPDGFGGGMVGGAPAYVDFGGYGPDQCGPYYFDVAAEVVMLQAEDLFKSVPPLASVGVAGPTIIDLENEYDDDEYGWQIAARYDLGALSVLEATYMGQYDIGFKDLRISEVETANAGQPVLGFQLNTVFDQYGLNPIDGLSEGQFYATQYFADLHSTEFSYRRYWLGYSPRVSGTFLLGFRYVNFNEDLIFAANTATGDGGLRWKDENDLLGFQFGGDGWVCLRQGLRMGAELKGGVYNNRWGFEHTTAIPDPDITNFDIDVKGNEVAFVGEGRIDVVADILPSFSIRAGYRAMLLNNLVTVGNNIFPDQFVDGFGDEDGEPLTHADVIFHGLHAGLEYIW